MKERILIVEDELPMRRSLEIALGGEGYRILTAQNGEEGIAKTLREHPDLVLLDVMMPKVDGFGVAAEIRRRGSLCPILMLTAKGSVDDRVAGLDAGADDYLVKPFSTRELLARVRAALRRRSQDQPEIDRIRLGECEVDFVRMTAKRRGKNVELTAKEFAMLRLLASERGGVVSREKFLDAIWGYGSFPTTRTVDTHIASLRTKLEKDPGHPAHILTVHRGGYRLEINQKPDAACA